MPFQIPRTVSDTTFIAENLALQDDDDILSFLCMIKGPWSIIYYQQQTKKLYFGRDVFGRHSLLWKLPSSTSPMFMLSSVCKQREGIQEVPAFGLYFIEFSESNFKEEFAINLLPWSHLSEDTFKFQNPYVKVKEQKIVSCISSPLNTQLPSECVENYLKSLPTSLDGNNIEALYKTMKEDIEKLLQVLTNSVQRRVIQCPLKCRDCTVSSEKCHHSRIAVLFSGGLDSAVIALLLDSCLPESESIDLLNVAFMQKVNQNNKSPKKGNTKHRTENVTNSSTNYDVPDRVSGRQCWEQLRELKPNRKWNFVEVSVTDEQTHCRTHFNIWH